MNHLYYGDNIDILRKYIKDESVDLCYIDPPFNSKRNYNQIYNNIGSEDKAQAQAFIDTWEWNSLAEQGYQDIFKNYNGKFTAQTISLITGLKEVLGKGSLLAYLVSITLRVVEIHRVLKPTGSFYLHCDPTASHYLKLILDAIFCVRGGNYINEMIWIYSRMAAKGQKQLSRCHDVIFWYAKGKIWKFNVDEIRLPYAATSKARAGYKKTNLGGGSPKSKICELNDIGKFPEDWIQIPFIRGKEYLGYQTQKPEALLERIIKASSNEGDIVLDAYCGCGTTVAVAQRLNRKWIGIDITYQSISLILKRLEDSYGSEVLEGIKLDGIPKDIKSAEALANRQNDRTRKEFEKWAVLTYSNNRAVINQKKGADRGIDGFAFFLEEGGGHKRIVLQVKSGNVSSRDIRELYGTMNREKAAMAIFITLKKPTSAMVEEAKVCGIYQHKAMGKSYPCVQIVTIKDMLENTKRLDIPLSLEVVKAAKKQANKDTQLELLDEPEAV
ncbi:MAG: DNA methyltransferase [Gloeotrichia echinulata GP01]